MKASDLRIGNFVNDRGGKSLRIDYWDAPDKVAQVMRINGGLVHPLTEDVRHLKPIPLIEEWLVKFGFFRTEINGNPNLRLNEFLRLELMKLGDDYCVFVVKHNNLENLFCLERIRHVHQIQNLYHALAGEELELKDFDYYLAKIANIDDFQVGIEEADFAEGLVSIKHNGRLVKKISNSISIELKDLYFIMIGKNL